MSERDENEVPEINADGALFNLISLRRELDYHRAIAAAAEEGLDDVCDTYEDEDLDDPEVCAHIATWAHRLSMALQAVSEVSHSMSSQAGILCELTRPKEPGELEN